VWAQAPLALCGRAQPGYFPGEVTADVWCGAICKE